MAEIKQFFILLHWKKRQPRFLIHSILTIGFRGSFQVLLLSNNNYQKSLYYLFLYSDKDSIMNLSLMRPTLQLEKEFFSAIKDFRDMGETDVEPLFRSCGENFYQYILKTQLIEAGKVFTNGVIPYSIYWLVLNQTKLIGFSHIRHYLTPALRVEGGHIGYRIRPSERQKGYGKKQLHMVLQECFKLGIKDVMITCDFDNVASYKIIEANGGVRFGEAISPRSKKLVFHYRISL